MESQFSKSTGLSLFIGSVLMITTMILHPTGGNIQIIIETIKPIRFAHGMAIFSLPFIIFGFWGLSNKLKEKRGLHVLAFIIVSLGLIAGMFAALFNGLALPYFLSLFESNLEDTISHLQPITKFSFAVNRALDYIFISSLCIALSMYSALIISTKKLPNWLGLAGIVLTLGTGFGMLIGIDLIKLLGFRIFVFSVAAWILITSYFLYSGYDSAK